MQSRGGRRTVNPDLVDVAALFELALELLDSNILALRQLEDVLLAVHDLDAAILLQLRNIAGVEPTVCLEHLGLHVLLRCWAGMLKL